MHEGSMNMECRLERSNHRAVFQNWYACAIECPKKFSPCFSLSCVDWVGAQFRTQMERAGRIAIDAESENVCYVPVG